MAHKIWSIIIIVMAWSVAGAGLYFIFFKGISLFHIIILLVGVIAVIASERNLVRVFTDK